MILVVLSAQAQKHDRNWVMGAVTITYPAPLFEMVVMKHDETGVIGFDTIPRIPKYRLNAGSTSYSDQDGNLSYYSNGKAIYNIAGEVMENGDSINFGQVWTQQSQSYGAINAIVPLKDISNPDSFSLLIHARLERGDIHAGLALYLDRILCTRIDLKANDGLGKVTEKDVILAEGIFENFTLVRHANGRDWWILTADTYQNNLRSILLSTQGVIQSNEQVIGPILFDSINNLSAAYGNLVPSHDGRFLARVNIRSGLWVYEFDRCTGAFVDYRGIKFEEQLWPPGGGVVGDFEFSPSGQYLYLISSGPCYQIDLWKDTLEMLQMEPLGVAKPYCNTGRRQMQLAPDGKIYMSPGTSSLCMHIIHYPDLPYPDCQFILNDVELPVYNHGSLVHYPNFRLGALEGSPCDTLGSVLIMDPDEDSGAGFQLYPNPATARVTLELDRWLSHDRNIQVRILSVTGQLMYQGTLPAFAYIHTIPLEGFTPGLYFTQVLDHNGQILGVEKLMVE
jgi:hypothetical protein